MNIYVGNLAQDVTEDDLREAFKVFGEVESINIVRDRVTSESRGFGFVVMPSKEEANAAITGMSNKELKGRSVKVAEARPKTGTRRASGRRGGFGGGRSGGREGFGGGRGGGRGGGGRRGGRYS